MLDRDLAKLYQVNTKILNQAVKRNIERFPKDFMFQLTKEEFENWKSQIVTSNSDKMGLRRPPYAFTEQGVSMLASVLKSKIAIQKTIAIIETFAKVKELTSTINELSANPPKDKQQSLMQYNIVIARRNDVAIFKNKQIISSYRPHNDAILDNYLQTNESETTIELNFAVLKFKHTVKKGNK